MFSLYPDKTVHLERLKKIVNVVMNKKKNNGKNALEI